MDSNDTILNLVGNAWAGFGAAFGTGIIISLLEGIKPYRSYFWYDIRISCRHYLDCFVKPLGEYNDFFNLYEIIPGFLTSLIVTYIVSLITKTE